MPESKWAVWRVALTEVEIARLAAGVLPREIRPDALIAEA